MTRYFILILCSLLSPLSVQASQHAPQNQEIALIKVAIEDFIHRNTATLPGQVIVNVDKIDKHLSISKCTKLEPFVPAGSRLWGKTSIGVRCNTQPGSWVIYVQAEINVMTDVLHISRPVSMGQIIVYEDITFKNVNLTHMPDGISINIEQVIGKVAATNLSAGQPLRLQMLRAPYIILRGQKVNLVIQGRGFSISSEGQALADAAEGKIVQVRNKSGRITSGIARIHSVVEIQH